MAGHNKWSKVKRLKAVTDGRRSKVFSSLSREITLAAKTGGGDPDGNARLRTLLLKAREANMPAENLDRAIKKGTGELPGIVYEQMTYEAYGPGGVAFVVQVTTDNKTRAAKDLRAIFSRHGGNLAATGSVMFQFLHAGQFLITREAVSEDALTELALEAGADDIITTAEGYELRCALHAFDRIAHALDDQKIKPASAELAYIPTTTVVAPTGHLAKDLAELHESLEALDDVQHVFSNEDAP
ncbi:MAG: YebC/PmpR family DNA-binding transcriptional regulator [Opitutaceae bacterium]